MAIETYFYKKVERTQEEAKLSCLRYLRECRDLESDTI